MVRWLCAVLLAVQSLTDLTSTAVLLNPLAAAEPPRLLAGEDVVFAEVDGLVAVEAEHFFRQTETDRRAFYLTTSKSQPDVQPDGDEAHVAGASGGAYLEILPDTRRTHGDKLIRGTNFSPEPGKMAVVSYRVHFKNAGRYYVWVRAHSTGSEDNGLHVGLNGEWPASGQRLQWCEGKRTWRWESKQRTEAQHCGEAHKIFLDIPQPGTHVISFSMREDGFEFDRWLMTKDRDFKRPEGIGPAVKIHSGNAPAGFPMVAAKPAADVKPSGGNGHSKPQPQVPAYYRSALVMSAADYPLAGTGFYLDHGKWAAINPQQRKSAAAADTFEFPTGRYNVMLVAVGENDGQSSYEVKVDGRTIGRFQTPLADQMFAEGKRFQKIWKNVQLTEGAVVQVAAEVGSKDGMEFSRARWAAIAFEPADDPTQIAAMPALRKQRAATKAREAAAEALPTDSPTKAVSKAAQIMPRKADGDGAVTISGEQKVWHKVTLTFDGPYAHEQDNKPNPFTDYRLQVQFQHSDGTQYNVSGFFAADGRAEESSAEAGTKWRVHFAPDRPGTWSWKASLIRGPLTALDPQADGTPVSGVDGQTGQLQIAASDRKGRDFRAHGRLQYVGKRYLQTAGTKQYFLKAGADAPETLLAYADFDNTIAGNAKKSPLKTWRAHQQDWQSGDPTWQDDKGKGLIGAINYLSGKGCNAFSFLTYNAGGDGDNVWPFIHRDDKLHYDCSKLDQWGIVFDHGTAKGMYLHFKMQETENDDHRRHRGAHGVPESLDGGNLGTQRKLYCRELIARFGHNLALNWNLGEENTQSTEQQQAMINYIHDVDPYDHHIVIHTFPNEQDKVYRPLLGDRSKLTGLSLQNSGIHDTHSQTVKWVQASQQAGKPWVVAFDESGTAAHGQCPDLGYEGYDGRDKTGKQTYTEHEVRHQTLWGTLLGGGAGVEYYFGYQYVQNDLLCEDWRSRDRSWDYCRIALNFFHDHDIPFVDMQPADELVGNEAHNNSRYCLAKAGDVYVIYLPPSESTTLDLTGTEGPFSVHWFNPREGGDLISGEVKEVVGGSSVEFGSAPDDKDWVVLVRRK